jgi:hypothetical protein
MKSEDEIRERYNEALELFVKFQGGIIGMNYENVFSWLKDYGRHKGKVWLTKGYCNDCKVVQLEYDHTRRYFMTPIYNRYDKVPPMQRVSRDVFENNVKYLLDKGYTLSF